MQNLSLYSLNFVFLTFHQFIKFHHYFCMKKKFSHLVALILFSLLLFPEYSPYSVKKKKKSNKSHNAANEDTPTKSESDC